MKTRRVYLLPKHMRLGQPSIMYIEKSYIGDDPCHALCVAFGETQFTDKTNGTVAAYSNRSCTVITSGFFADCLKEAKYNRERYKLPEDESYFFLSWYEKNDEADLVGTQKLQVRPCDIAKWFGVPEKNVEDEMFIVTKDQLKTMAPFVEKPIDLEKYEYFVDYFAG